MVDRDYGDPEKYVGNWLDRHGYRVEYEVARRLQSHGGLEVEQGRYWRDTDPRTGERKGRELDVVARRVGERTIVQLVVECKYLARPWVVFEREGARTSNFAATVEMLMAGAPARRFLAAHYGDSSPPWHLKGSAAFNIVETRDKGERRPAETAFDVVSGLIRGAWAIHQATPKAKNALTLPALVVDGDLILVSYDAAGERVIRSSDFERLTWAGAVLPGASGYEREQPVTVDVLTVRGLDSWVPESIAGIHEIFMALEAKRSTA